MRAVGLYASALLSATLVAAVVAFSLTAARFLPIVAVAENFTADWMQSLFEPYAPQNPDIVILTIKEDTLAQFPFRSPLDRAYLADVLDTLNARKVKAVGIDMLFDQPTLPDADQKFLAAARRFEPPLVLGWTDEATQLTERQYQFQKQFLTGLRTGFVNLVTDAGDGVARFAFAGRFEDGAWHPGFAAAVAEGLGYAAPREMFRIHYRLGPDLKTLPFREYPLHTLRALPAAWFTGKVVLIGADLPYEDRVRTPLAAVWATRDGSVPGVTIHAHALAQLMGGETGLRTSLPLEIMIAALLGFAALGLAAWERTVPVQLLAAGGVILWLWGGVAYLYWSSGTVLPLIAPSLAFAVGLFAAVGYVGYQRRLQGQFVREAFGRYVSPAVVKRLEMNPDELTLGGEKRDVSVLFTDIEGFTTFAERQEPAALVGTLNRYLHALSMEVERFGGMVDKFIGDAVMAIFGAPERQADHAARAIACARAMRDVSVQLRHELAGQGIRLGRTRIGVHSGPAVVGNVGGERRFDYTAIGDVVNTASRLEGANKYFGTDIVISGAARDAAGGDGLRPIGALTVKGRNEGLYVFTPADGMPAEQAGAYIEAYRLMAAGESAALAAFERYLARFPDDSLARFHHRRLMDGEGSDLIVLEGK